MSEVCSENSSEPILLDLNLFSIVLILFFAVSLCVGLCVVVLGCLFVFCGSCLVVFGCGMLCYVVIQSFLVVLHYLTLFFLSFLLLFQVVFNVFRCLSCSVSSSCWWSFRLCHVVSNFF